ncbi:F-box/WD repeat-containing protein 9 [Sardina pilchardus]|uniref:F-box/WD repeat-containing protein 9 n=1 Tax=Sardina pilchardus TaxID=27697 RepID=UPI002E0DD769
MEEIQADAETGSSGGRETASRAGESESDGIAHLDLDQMRLCVGSSEGSRPESPSPCSDGVGLLSLPWEMVTRIASHLPAQCIINVLPQVCRVLGEVGEDASVWQHRAQRLVGGGASFPAGPREQLDWAAACLEMEQLLLLWSSLGERRRAGGAGGGAGGAERNVPEGQEGAREEEEEERGGGGAGERNVPEGAREEEEAQRGGEEAQAQRGEEQEVRRQPEGGAAGGGQEERRGGAERLQQEEHRGGAEERHEQEEQRGGAEERAGEERHEQEEQRGVGVGEERDVVAMEVERREEVQEEEEEDLLPSLERFSLPPGHIADVHSVLLFGGQGSLCATGSRDRNVNLWDLRQEPGSSGGSPGGSRGRLLQTLGGAGGAGAHSGWVWCLAEREGLLASGAFDSTIRLWDLANHGAPRGVITGRAPVICLSWQPDALLAGSHDKKIRVYDHRASQPLVKTLQLHSSAVLSLEANERYIISGGKDNTIALYDRRAAKLLNKLTLGSFLLSMSSCGQEVWAGDNLGQIHTFSLQHGLLRPLGRFNVGHTHLVTGIHYSPGSLYTCSSDRTIRVHLPSAPPRTVCTLQNPTPVNGLSVEAGVLAVASGNMAVAVWRPPQ